MKIPASIRRIYEEQKALNDRLRVTIDERMLGLKNRRWHYESRIKELVSFALKIESGRFDNPQALEDFLACTIVVVNVTEIAEAEVLIRENFAVKVRRPQSAKITHKAPNAFPFDDLRLYVTLKESPAVPPTDLFGVIFEVQIKTFLQHAWSIATHDLLYKTDDVDWNKERIAFQVKAMLEHAEVSIQEAESLAACGALAKVDKRTEAVKEGIALLKSQWDSDELPEDLRRLALNIDNLLQALQLDTMRLGKILNDGKSRRGGAHPANLSPYATVVQYLFDAERERLLLFLRGKNKGTRRIFLAEEIELPPDVDLSRVRNAVWGTSRQERAAR